MPGVVKISINLYNGHNEEETNNCYIYDGGFMNKNILVLFLMMIVPIGLSARDVPGDNPEPIPVPLPPLPLPISVGLNFLQAARAGNLAGVIHGLALGVSIDYQNDSGETALYCAADKGRLIIVQELIGRGARLNLGVGPAGKTALRKAMSNLVRDASAYQPIVNELVIAGASEEAD